MEYSLPFPKCNRINGRKKRNWFLDQRSAGFVFSKIPHLGENEKLDRRKAFGYVDGIRPRRTKIYPSYRSSIWNSNSRSD
jgi:hypothetical protein